MFTEQDTFDRLRRIPYEEMRELVHKFYMNHAPLDIKSRGNLCNLFEEYGWTLKDYNIVVKLHILPER